MCSSEVRDPLASLLTPNQHKTYQTMARLKGEQFRFRRHERLGAEGAEEDEDLLFECFIDTGELALLENTEDPRRIVVGRTGTGKTALLQLVALRQEHVKFLEPDSLALQYLSRYPLLRNLEELGVKLDIFYRLLWRHIFAVELIQLRYNVRTEEDQKHFFDRIASLLRGDKRKQAAIDYLVKWGKHFWEDTEIRIQEVTETLEKEITASLGAKSAVLTGGIEKTKRLTKEERQEISHRAQAVVNAVQIQRLSEIVGVLADEVFDDPQQHFYVLLDRLDENWVEDALRYRLIRALLETIKDLQKIRQAKVIVALSRLRRK